MKIKHIYAEIVKPRHKLIARFGHARLVRWRDGKYQLIGGLPEDLAEAREWISLFLHEAVPACAAVVAASRKSAAISRSQVRTTRCNGQPNQMAALSRDAATGPEPTGPAWSRQIQPNPTKKILDSAPAPFRELT